jgi:NAD(P)-dependent dehydrogenase (short-subunit alcohol dehydrogenase family)
LITGAGSGIGKAIAHRFHQAGYHVAIFDVNSDAAQVLSSEMRDGAKTLVIQGDASNEHDARAAVEKTVFELSSLDVLVNNVGVELNGTVVEQPSADWDRQIAVNLRSVYLFSKYAMPALEKVGGSIVNISSVHAFMSWPRCPAYDATKAGILGITRAMAIDHGWKGIRVNAVCPGYIETPLLMHWFASGRADKDEVLKFHPLGRIGTPDDIANAVFFLASEDASFISGAALTVDGALTAFGR